MPHANAVTTVTNLRFSESSGRLTGIAAIRQGELPARAETV